MLSFRCGLLTNVGYSDRVFDSLSNYTRQLQRDTVTAASPRSIKSNHTPRSRRGMAHSVSPFSLSLKEKIYPSFCLKYPPFRFHGKALACFIGGTRLSRFHLWSPKRNNVHVFK